MASVEDYIDLGGALVSYVEASASLTELQNAFKDDGLLSGTLKTLDSQEEQLNAYHEVLLKSFDPERTESLSQEQVNKQIAKNDDERNEIVHLRSSLNELFDAFSKPNSSFTKCRAISEFIKSVEKGKKVDISFFKALICVIKNIFTFVDKEELEETKLDLKATFETIIGKQGDRVEIPGKASIKKIKKKNELKSVEVQDEASQSSSKVEKISPEPVSQSQNAVADDQPPPSQIDTLDKADDISLPPQQVAADKVDDLLPPPLSDKMADLPPPPSDVESDVAIEPEKVRESELKEASNVDMTDEIPKPPQASQDKIDKGVSKEKVKVKRVNKSKAASIK
jgi:hypothetical protein